MVNGTVKKSSSQISLNLICRFYISFWLQWYFFHNSRPRTFWDMEIWKLSLFCI